MTILANLRRKILEENLTYCEIPNSVIYIDIGAFWGCTSLTSITIPNSVTEIAEGAFEDCTGLTYIITTNPLITTADAAQKEQWAIPNGCEIISPEVFCQQKVVTEVLRNITHDHLTPEQIIFLYMTHPLWKQLKPDELHTAFDPALQPSMQKSITQQQTIFLYINRHRWAELTLQELQTHLGEAPLTLLQQIQPPLWETVYNGLSVLTKASLFSQGDTSLTPIPFFDALCSSYKIKDAQIALKLSNVAKPESTQSVAKPAPVP